MVGRIAVIGCVLAVGVGCSAPAEERCAKLLPGTYKETAAYLETTAASAVGTGTIEVRDRFGFVCRAPRCLSLALRRQ